ncbi:MAG TPA: 2,3-bisphosphoglycerate-independent phosphoglycerate mutase [Opitutales bacterium]|nr:2,3-bisphosphoglycerate-independent phosphoglycerate mutase [Opitutales bacterium]
MSSDSEFKFLQDLLRPNDSKIILLVLDGLGGLPTEGGDGATVLEAAETPNLDALAEQGICGLHEAAGTGVTPGSGPAHLALFGYDPRRFQVGRGVLSALGIGFDLQDGDVAARGNFCSMDDEGCVTDRRAGRIDSEKGRELCRLLKEIEVPGVELFVEPVKEYRFVLVLRGRDLSPDLGDTDPQATGKEALPPKPGSQEAERSANLVQQFLEEARKKLCGQDPANMVLLRGFSSRPDWPTFQEAFGLRAAALADYPMYRGVARLLEMDALDCGQSLENKIELVKAHWDAFDFFYIHVKRTDSAGEDGDTQTKQAQIEQVDQHLPALRELEPDVLMVTGDHSTPAAMQSHSWHPVPTVLWAKNARPDAVKNFGERVCIAGGLGPRFPTTDLMPLSLAHAGRLRKFGA